MSLSCFFKIPVKIENASLKIALALPTGTPITVANDAVEMLPVVTDTKIIKNIKIVKRINVFTEPFAH